MISDSRDGTGGVPPRATPGPVLFARYAFPPNHHGYCGPQDDAAFFESGTQGADAELRALAREFAGAWPYLELIAHSTGIQDPLDPRVVEAYWIGSRRLEHVGYTAMGNSMEDRFRFRTGGHFASLAEGVVAGGVPHHSFAVFCVYPWSGLLRDDQAAEKAVEVLDLCRIRWGRVVAVLGDQVVAESAHLTWDGHRLAYDEPRLDTVEQSIDGLSLSRPLRPGDWVAMHWDWVCDRLSDQQVRALAHYSQQHLDIVNAAQGSGPLGVLG